MRIKEVEALTGLSAKTIRFYESKELIYVKRSYNSYREYDDDTVKQLKEIKLLRKLDISLSNIKDYLEGAITLENLMKERLEQVEKDELNITNKKSTYKEILKELEKNSTIDIDAFLEVFDFYESKDYAEMINELDAIFQPSLTMQVLYTLMLSGPLLWLWLNLSQKKYDFIVENVIASLICTVILTLSWQYYIRNSKKVKKKKTGAFAIFLGLFGAIFITIVFFILIGKLQELIFVPDEYLLYMFKPPYSYLVFFFEVEILILIIQALYKINKSHDWKWAASIFNFVKKNALLITGVNLLLLYVCITGVTVVTQDKIVDYSFYKPSGVIYSYEVISKVETGFRGKAFGVLRKNAGDFYYIVNFKDGTKVDFYQASSPYEDTYLELEIFDDLIMKNDVEKISSSDNSQFCDFDQRYIDRFLRIISNR